MKRTLTLVFLSLILCGCGLSNRLVVRMSRPLIEGTMEAILSETDPEIARTAMEAHLKLLEGMIVTAPNDRQLLTLAAQGFTGYALLFVEAESKERASGFYLRGKEYGLRALFTGQSKLGQQDPTFTEWERAVRRLDRSDVAAAYWTGAAWSAYINLNRDRPAAIASFARARLLFEQVYRLDPNYYYSGPRWMLGLSYAGLPKMVGGGPEIAWPFFREALDADGDRFLLGKVLCAEYYAVSAGDSVLFRRLLQEAIIPPPVEPPELRLLNRMAARRAAELLRRIEELF
ncbi:MAG: hypothetical protein FJY67_01355 [Calditrichaeota bacterium]|nr:hypothetical protein [Calditrichota bacterium]